MIKIPFIHEIKDFHARENFRAIRDSIRLESLLKGNFVFFSKSLAAPDGATYPATVVFGHGLTFKPLDIIQTSVIGAGVPTWNYSSFDSENLSVTITDSCTVRFFAGRYEEN